MVPESQERAGWPSLTSVHQTGPGPPFSHEGGASPAPDSFRWALGLCIVLLGCVVGPQGHAGLQRLWLLHNGATGSGQAPSSTVPLRWQRPTADGSAPSLLITGAPPPAALQAVRKPPRWADAGVGAAAYEDGATEVPAEVLLLRGTIQDIVRDGSTGPAIAKRLRLLRRRVRRGGWRGRVDEQGQQQLRTEVGRLVGIVALAARSFSAAHLCVTVDVLASLSTQQVRTGERCTAV